MKDRVYFTREEAKDRVGTDVEAIMPFPSVPEGTTGKVTKASRFIRDYYVVEVKWETTRPTEFIDFTVGETSFNWFRKRKPVTDEFCKSEFSEMLNVLHVVEDM